MVKQKAKAKKRAKTLHKAIVCATPANHIKAERAKTVLVPYQNAMTFFIHHMNQQLLMGQDIVSHQLETCGFTNTFECSLCSRSLHTG